jgi:predicted ATPase/DNA-binding SARP family transcriptional activator
MAELWRIEMLGGLRAIHPDRVITRFRSQKAGSLLAYLAFFPHQAHSREQLIEVLWPETDLDWARDKLRVALYSLRRQLEPPGVASGAVITADRRSVQLNPAAVGTDVAQFEAALRSADRTNCIADRCQSLHEAVELYRGPLLPTCFEAWVMPEQQRLSGLFFHAITQLVHLLEQEGELLQALDHAGRAMAADPLREEGQREYIRLLDRVGQPTAALEQYRRMERLLWEELNEKPSVATSRLVAHIELRAAAVLQEGAAGQTPAAPPSPSVPTAPHRPAPQDVSPAPQQEPASKKAASPWSSTIPLQLTRFFGREREIAQLGQLLSPGRRLVTLTGPGGSGKTRLAIELGRTLLEVRQGAVWWVPLMDVAAPHLIAEAIREAMQLPSAPLTPAFEQVMAALTERSEPTLLVLDNFEHLVEGGAELVQELLEHVPALQCLVTSRQLLNLAAEQEFPVEPLPVPAPSRDREGAVYPAHARPLPHGRGSDLSALTQCASVQLFIDRAQAVRPAFQITEANAAAVAELCRRLEGIPLAIELAAAHTRLLSPEQMLAMLARRFEFLASRRRDLPTRHRALRAAIEGNVQLLSPDRQRFFAQLCLFRGGWTLEAAAAVCTDTGSDATASPVPDALDALSALTELRERSLVQAEAVGAGMRYRMLETLWEYATEQLSAEELAALSERHARYYMALAEEAEPYVGISSEREEWLDRLDREHENIRAAVGWCLETGEAEVGMRLVGALRRFWWWRSYLREGQEYLRQLLALPGAAGHTAARGKALLAAVQVGVKPREGVDFAEECLGIFRELGDRKREAVAIRQLAGRAFGHGYYETARRLYEEDLAICREIGDKGEMAGTVGNLSLLASHQGNHQEAWSLHEQGAALLRELGAGFPVWDAILFRIRQGDLATARSILEERLACDREGCLTDNAGRPLYYLAVILLRQGEPAAARGHLAQQLHIHLKVGRKHPLPECLEVLAAVSAAEGDADQAARLFGACEALREAAGTTIAPADRAVYEEWVASARAQLAEQAFASAWAEGRQLSLDQVTALAVATASGSAEESPPSRPK